MKKLLVIFFAGTWLLLLGWNFPTKNTPGLEGTLRYFQKESQTFATSALALQQAIAALSEKDQPSLARVKIALAQCRQDYKKLEFFLEYFFPSTSKVYNAPPEFEVEEPSLEFQEPMGLQQIEALLFTENPGANKKEMLLQAEAVRSSANDLPALLHNFTATDNQILEALRIELIRVMTLSVTGYDAPQLKTGIPEAQAAMYAIGEILNFYFQPGNPEHQKLKIHLAATVAYLQAQPNFNTFNRLVFLKKYALPLQKQVGRLITSLGLELNSHQLLNYQADHLFSKKAFRTGGFRGLDSISPELILLGEKLFFEKSLSGNNTRSCATCHVPENYFTDQLPQSPALNGHSFVKRNAPTLLYSGLQHAQFWDGRSSSLTDQITTVLQNTSEMNGNVAAIQAFAIKNTTYQPAFQAAFPTVLPQNRGVRQVAVALAAYVGNLNFFNSAFDTYLQGNEQALTPAQVNGFNLFAGKAKCATCHFMPLFNALLPPDYAITEYEVIGTTLTDDLQHPVVDPDSGRFGAYPIKFYKNAFKTPTVRNAAKTAPYMHNGSFKNLKTVVEFYNKGGGHGLGLANKLQTLSPEPLNLTHQEMDDIVQFMQALTDELPSRHSISSHLIK